MNENQQNSNFYDISKYTIDKAMQFISPRYVLQVSSCPLHCFQCTVIDRYMENTRCFDPENMEANEDRTMFEEVSTIRPNFKIFQRTNIQSNSLPLLPCYLIGLTIQFIYLLTSQNGKHLIM